MIRRETSMPLVWNVYTGGFNSKEIVVRNVFDHHGFWEDLVKAKRKFGNDRDAFAEEVRRSLMYYYWSKCEWEVIIDHWPHYEDFHEAKIDVYDQVRMNWDIFIDYVWNNKSKIKKIM